MWVVTWRHIQSFITQQWIKNENPGICFAHDPTIHGRVNVTCQQRTTMQTCSRAKSFCYRGTGVFCVAARDITSYETWAHKQNWNYNYASKLKSSCGCARVGVHVCWCSCVWVWCVWVCLCGYDARVGVRMCGCGNNCISTTLHIYTVPATRAHSNSDLLLKHSWKCWTISMLCWWKILVPFAKYWSGIFTCLKSVAGLTCQANLEQRYQKSEYRRSTGLRINTTTLMLWLTSDMTRGTIHMSLSLWIGRFMPAYTVVVLASNVNTFGWFSIALLALCIQ